MVKLIFVNGTTGVQMLEFTDPPTLPVVGDLTESPDGRLWQIAQRAYLIGASSKIQIAGKTPTPVVEVRCMIFEVQFEEKPFEEEVPHAEQN